MHGQPRLYFYPRPPRGGRPGISTPRSSCINFYPRPPRGGRLQTSKPESMSGKISIHALREEGDLRTRDSITRFALFLSTPSARRATPRVWTRPSRLSNFYPRPPRGGRPKNSSVSVFRVYFYPRPPRGGRPSADGKLSLIKRFLSTPSARRATAKTETKSLFSNKLYNILHEFRRALIYNGSKNYPNHAK